MLLPAFLHPLNNSVQLLLPNETNDLRKMYYALLGELLNNIGHGRPEVIGTEDLIATFHTMAPATQRNSLLVETSTQNRF